MPWYPSDLLEYEQEQQELKSKPGKYYAGRGYIRDEDLADTEGVGTGSWVPGRGWVASDTGTSGTTGTTSGTTSGTDVEYSVNPSTQEGSGAYGAVPGAIGIPETTYEGVSSIYPGLTGTTSAVSDLINSQLAGEFTPDTEAALWDTANRYGVASGMGGAGLWSNKFMGNVAGAKESLQQQGLTNYNSVLNNLSKMVTDQDLAAEIAARNAEMSASPNPEEAADQLKEDTTSGVTSGYRTTYNPSAGTTYNYGTGSTKTDAEKSSDAIYQQRLKDYNNYWNSQGTSGSTGSTTSDIPLEWFEDPNWVSPSAGTATETDQWSGLDWWEDPNWNTDTGWEYDWLTEEGW